MEGIADLLAAETAAQHRQVRRRKPHHVQVASCAECHRRELTTTCLTVICQALQQASGVHKRRYEAWRRTLLNCLAHVEAVIDFGDDNDIDSGVAAEVLPGAISLRQELEGHLRDGEAPAQSARRQQFPKTQALSAAQCSGWVPTAF